MAHAADVPAKPVVPVKPTIAVFNPVNLHLQTTDHNLGELLRKAFQDNPKWKLISRDTVLARFRDYKMDATAPCHEFQCSFDAGNVLAAEYVMFGSITPWGDLYAYTLNITHVRSSQVIWSRVGEVLRRQSGESASALEGALVNLVEEIDPEDLDTRRGLKRGLLTLLDLSPGGSTPSRVMAERVATHLYASRNFDIMSRRELEELLAALEVRKADVVPSDSGIFALGGKMDITHLVYSRLIGKGFESRGGERFQLQLALYDIAGKKKVREWPSQPTSDIRKLLEFENKFFSSLFKTPEYESSRGAQEPGLSPVWTVGSVGLGLALSTVFGVLAYSAWQEADQNYQKFKEARSRESALASKERVETSERKALIFTSLGSFSLAGAGAMLVVSF